VRQATVLLILCFQIGTLLQGVRNNNGLISCSGRHLKSHVMLTYSESFIIVHIRHCCTAWRRPESLRCYRAGGVGGVVGSHASDAPIASDDPGHTPAEGKTDCFLFCSSTCTVSIPASVTHLRSKRLIYLGVSWSHCGEFVDLSMKRWLHVSFYQNVIGGETGHLNSASAPWTLFRVCIINAAVFLKLI
jgi:hypothetical protein